MLLAAAWVLREARNDLIGRQIERVTDDKFRGLDPNQRADWLYPLAHGKRCRQDKSGLPRGMIKASRRRVEGGGHGKPVRRPLG